MAIDRVVTEFVAEIQRRGLERTPYTIEGVQGARVRINKQEFISFCSNDYLGLTQRRELADVTDEAIREFGVGSGGSRLLAGNSKYHVELEKRFAEFKGYESATLFNSAYLATMGIVTSLADQSWTIFSDQLNHASIVDACRLSRAKVVIYPHSNTDFIATELERTSGNKIIITEALFSMDGDIAPLANIVELAKNSGAILLVDDTHGTGIFGSNGRGVIDHLGLSGKIDAEVSNLSKAGGFIGGFVLGDLKLRRLIISKARTLLYTTSLPPFICAMGLRVIDSLVNAEKERKTLLNNVDYLRNNLEKIGIKCSSQGPIFPILLGTVEKAVSASVKLYQEGLLVPAIRPPTVPDGTSRLRISITALHEKNQIDRLVDALQRL